jgi:hypothetical protein
VAGTAVVRHGAELGTVQAGAEQKQDSVQAALVVPVAAAVAEESKLLEPEAIRGEVLRHRHSKSQLQQAPTTAEAGQDIEGARVVPDGERQSRSGSRSPADSRSSSGRRASVREQHDEWRRATKKLQQGVAFKVRRCISDGGSFPFEYLSCVWGSPLNLVVAGICVQMVKAFFNIIDLASS